MIIGAYVRHSVPDHPAGAEWSMQDTMAALVERGHRCVVLSEKGHTRTTLDGVAIHSQPTEDEAAKHFLACDVMLTQMEAAMQAQIYASHYRTPLVHLIHSAAQLENTIVPGASALVVHNSDHVADACAWWPGEAMILHPVVSTTRVLVEPLGQLVTLVNVSHAKGGAMLLRVAALLPERIFLGVMGAYGDQVFDTHGIPGHGDNPLPTTLPPNVGVSPPTADIRSIMAASRVVLLLSRNETYGRVAAEAMVSGIPVIAFWTPGVDECCGPAALYAQESAVEVARAVERVHAEWPSWSSAALKQAQTVRERTAIEIADLERRLRRIVVQQPPMNLGMEPHNA